MTTLQPPIDVFAPRTKPLNSLAELDKWVPSAKEHVASNRLIAKLKQGPKVLIAHDMGGGAIFCRYFGFRKD